MDIKCHHPNVSCLNQHEIIRKYRCADCSAVMMCDCDEDTGRRFLPYQLSEGQESKTGVRVPVTHGFVSEICNTCRGLPEPAAPMAKMFGCTSKVRRYYWREILVRKLQRSADSSADTKNSEEIERWVIEEIKAEHERAPKYSYAEESENEFMERVGISFKELKAEYLPSPDRKIRVQGRDAAVGVEGFVVEHLEAEGFSVIETESVPFHTLFSIYAWMLIQDQSDPLVRAVQFGRRDVWEQNGSHEMMWCLLPEDFGKQGYAERRRSAITTFFSDNLREDREDLLHLFDYWLDPSWSLRQYLWAHRPENAERARKIVEVLPPAKVIGVVQYLLESYWERFLGWPDLLAWRSDTVRFIEVKSSKDKLSAEQKRWIADNQSVLSFDFEVIKVHRSKK